MDDIFAVQRTLKDVDNRLGLFHELDNAKRQADNNWGYNVYRMDTRKLVYKPAITHSQALVGALTYMDRVVRKEIANGLIWRYSNGSLKKENTFEKARSSGHRALNCVDGVQWGMILSKCVPSNRDGLSWYGLDGGFRWLRADAEERVRKYFNIIEFEMSAKKALKYNLLKPGDTCTFHGMAHTNCYLGDGRWFDSGHANCTKSGEKAPFTGFIGNFPYGNYKLGKILRPIDGIFRVQCGIFTKKSNAKKRMQLVKDAGFDVLMERDGRDFVIQCGLFQIEQNAINLAARIEEAGIPVLVKEI